MHAINLRIKLRLSWGYMGAEKISVSRLMDITTNTTTVRESINFLFAQNMERECQSKYDTSVVLRPSCESIYNTTTVHRKVRQSVIRRPLLSVLLLAVLGNVFYLHFVRSHTSHRSTCQFRYPLVRHFPSLFQYTPPFVRSVFLYSTG